MPSAKLVAALAAGALAVTATCAGAATHSTAKLASPAAQPLTATIGDATWRCEGDACMAERKFPTIESPMKECRRVAAEFGALAAFNSEGLKFDAGDLRACNRAAKTDSAAATGK